MNEEEFSEKKFEEWQRNAFPPKRKRADPPHPLTIALAFLSPAVACAAVWISLNSLRLSTLSVEVAQRAYVSLVPTKLELVELPIMDTLFRVMPSGPRGKMTKRNMWAQFDISNLGNTPANVTSVWATYSVPKEWQFEDKPAKETTVKVMDSVGALGPKSSVHRSVIQAVLLPANDLALQPEITDFLKTRVGVYRLLKVNAYATYIDVFNKQSETHACFEMALGERNPLPCLDPNANEPLKNSRTDNPSPSSDSKP